MATKNWQNDYLISICGLTPQVVTETLYALWRHDSSHLPDTIHIMTTAVGKQRVLATLTGPQGKLAALKAEWGLPADKLQLLSENIRVVGDHKGVLLDDIRSDEENILAADSILAWVAGFTSQSDSRIHASIAGGRKSMGVYLANAMSFLGRPQDQISHILVSPQVLEFHPDFFFPTRQKKLLTSQSGEMFNAADARVALGLLPFVRLAHLLPESLKQSLVESKMTYHELACCLQSSLEPPRLVVDYAGGCVTMGGKTFPLPPAQLALLGVFARRAKKGRPPVSAPNKHVPDSAWARRFLDEYQRIKCHAGHDSTRTTQALAEGMDGDYFSPLKSKLNRTIREALGPGQAAACTVKSTKGRSPKYYLAIAPEYISFIEADGVTVASEYTDTAISNASDASLPKTTTNQKTGIMPT